MGRNVTSAVRASASCEASTMKSATTTQPSADPPIATGRRALSHQIVARWEHEESTRQKSLNSLPTLPRHAATVAAATALLCAAWKLVLKLPREFILDDSMPFGSLGGDSISALALDKLCQLHGLQLLPEALSTGIEVTTIATLMRTARTWRGEGFVRPERQARRKKCKEALQAGLGGGRRARRGQEENAVVSNVKAPKDVDLDNNGTAVSAAAGAAGGAAVSTPTGALAFETPLSESSTARHTVGARRALSFTILERDGSARESTLLPVGGLSACAAGYLSRARELAASGIWSPNTYADRHGSNALMWAAGGGHAHIVHWLLCDQRVAIDATNLAGRTALMFACKTGSCEVANGLLELGADPTLRQRDGTTAFDWAVRRTPTGIKNRPFKGRCPISPSVCAAAAAADGHGFDPRVSAMLRCCRVTGPQWCCSRSTRESMWQR